ncbi:MAG: ankyrin repeat domain-containing protein [Spirochaetales bacterium]|nr:ankyrin repeat domain-containing protein [Spirochaetales bacterium]
MFAYRIEMRFAQALLDNDTAEVARLIELGLDIDMRFSTTDNWYKNLMPHYSPLMYCIATGKFEMAEFLINNGAELNYQDDLSGDTALGLAVHYENYELVKLLLKKGADPNIPRNYLGPALFITLLDNNYDLFELLIEYHADIFYKNKYFDDEIQTALDCAEFAGSRKAALYLKKAGVQNGSHPQNKEEMFIRAVKDNDMGSVKKYIGQGIDLNCKDRHKKTALMWASMYGYHDLVRLLLEHGADMDDGRGNSHHIPLLTAAYNGDLKLVKLFLDKGTDINIQDKFGSTALLLSCSKQYIEVAEYLLDRGADPSKKHILGLDAFWYAFEKRNYALLELLIGHKTDMNGYYPTWYYCSAPYFPATALYQAMFFDDVAMVKFLVRHGADVNIPNHIGLSPLTLAVAKDNYALTELLIKHGADVHYVDKKEHDVFYYADKLKNPKIIKLLKRTAGEYAAPDYEGNRMAAALEADDLEYIRLLVERGADVNQKIIEDYTPLMAACEQGNPAIVEYLIAHKARINDAAEDLGMTPLMIAAAHGNTDVVELLLKHNADINAKNVDGLTALGWAILHNHSEAKAVLRAHNAVPGDIVKYISYATPIIAATSGNYELIRLAIKHNIGIEYRDHAGCTPLMRAAELGHADIVELLLTSGADPNIQNDFGDTALMTAVDAGQLESVRALLKHNVDLELKDEYNSTALCIACKRGYAAIAKLLIEHNADANITDKYNKTLLDNALLHGYKKISLLLAAAIKEFDKPGYLGLTPLMYAAWKGFLDVCEVLIQRGANINLQDKNDRDSALHMAAAQGHADVVKLLLAKGARLDIHNKEGKTPLDLAREAENQEIIDILLQAGAKNK